MAYGTAIVSCGCQNEYQDQLYGKGRRVYNVMKSGNGRCTVCLAVKNNVAAPAVTTTGKEIK